MEDDLKCDNLSCCSFGLSWKDKNEEENAMDSYEYELYQKEGSDNIFINDFNFNRIYKGKEAKIEILNLKPNTTYALRLKIMKAGHFAEEKKISITTLKSPLAMLSKESINIENKNFVNYDNTLTDSDKEMINICSKLIFGKNNENIMEGNFNAFRIKLTHKVENNMYFISFEVLSEYFYKFLKRYIEESENYLILPCYFIIQNLPTTLILSLLNKGPVIFTGIRMGGVIASSLAFYILLIGRLKNNKFGNAFINKEKNCLGVVTFGSPSFLSNMAVADKMKEFIPYFYHVKEEFDYIPEIVDFINKDQMNKNVLEIFNKMVLDLGDINLLKKFFEVINFTENNLKNNIKKLNKIPFGRYFMLKASDNSFTLFPRDEKTFFDFYYYKIFASKNQTSDLKLYSDLESNVIFDKEPLQYLINKNDQLEFIKIIRRNIDNKRKGIIKFKLNEIDNNNSADIIDKITLIIKNKKYTIETKNIYYDNNVDITAYMDDLKDNINEVIIYNSFGGEMKVKHIINIQGSEGSTREMLKNNIEKLFLIPFFKLFEIFYSSLKNEDKYNNLKEKNFGKEFNNLKILEPFELQIKTINDLLFFSRPDIIGKFESKFFKEYIDEKLNEKQMKSLEEKFKLYYEKAIEMQINQKINCFDSEKDSIAKKCSFPQKKIGKKGNEKLFMCERDCFKYDDFIFIPLNDSLIKEFFIKPIMVNVLQKIEYEIISNLNNIKNEEDCKKYLNSKIGEIYKEQVIPNVYFILILILSSIESGDYIKFNHEINWDTVEKAFSDAPFKLFFSILFSPSKFGKYFEKNFQKFYESNKIEEMHLRNLFSRKKTKNIVNSNISPNYLNPKRNDLYNINKIKDFSEYSENQKFGKEYYQNFLQLFNNYSNNYLEDIEISIYDNLKEENDNKIQNFKEIKDVVEYTINDEESKKGFLALVRQSYLLGKFRTNIVSIINLFSF